MKREVSLKYQITKEEQENFLHIIEFLRRKGFPVDFKSIIRTGLNQALNTYFEKEWGKEKSKKEVKHVS